MKFYTLSRCMHFAYIKKLLLVMRLTLFLLTTALLQISLASDAQKVTCNLKNVPIITVFQEISRQTGYEFLYTDEMLNEAIPVSIVLKDASVNDALSRCFKEQPLAYTIKDKTIIIQRKAAEPPAESKPATVNKMLLIPISGVVKDNKGQPIPGATVKIKGTAIGSITDVSGNFSLSAPDPGSTLVISFIGFTTQEIVIKDTRIFNIVLLEEAKGLNDIVVVGYGTQKKINLTGSVATINSEEINKRAAPNAANLLEGKIAGLEVVQPSGAPGQDAPILQIRGLGSFGASSAPLVLIDGVIGDLNTISATDIDNISVLKDAASSSIYGNRAANGVILVTTKRGRTGSLSISYSDNFSLNQATRLPDLVYNSAEYMEMFNAANLHTGLPAVYSQAQIDAYKNAPANSLQYPNYNWIDNFVNNAYSQDHHLNANGGNDNTTYNFSLGYLKQSGVIQSNNYDRYNMLFSLDSKVNKTFKIGTTIAFNKSTLQTASLTGDNLALDLYTNAPTYGPFLPDGSGRLASSDYIGSPALRIFSLESSFQGSNIRTDNYEARTQAYVETKIFDGLTWLVKGAFNYNDQFVSSVQNPEPEYFYQPDASGNYQFRQNSSTFQLGVTNYDTRNLYLNAYTTLNYEKNIAKDHHLNILAGYSVESFTDQTLSGNRSVFPSTALTEINAGSSTGQILNGDEYQYALQSFFGRINYNYKEKYLLEFDGRYDGTSRIAPTKRYGLFPSVSAGWRVSQEDFLKNVSWIDNLKVRASYGKLGNQEIGNYPYQDILNIVNYSFGRQSTSQGAQLQTLTDKSLQWETTNVADIGLDLSLKNGIFSVTADYYNKKTTGILTQPTILYAIGLNPPTTNFGTLQNRGIELNLGHRYAIGKDFRYSVNAILSVNRNKLLKINATQDKGMYIDKVGLPYDSYYLTKWIGIFQSQDEINSSPVQQYTPKPGDLKYQDINGDNKINASDRQVVSGLYPDYTYSFSINMSYKQFDFSSFFQGVQGIKRYVTGFGAEPFEFSGPPPTYFENAWTPQNHSQTIPAIYTAGYYLPDEGVASTYFLKDASYLRLKNVQLTYHLPVNIAHKLLMKTASVHISADNLFTFTKFMGDPERNQYDGTYANYPQIKIFSAGLNVQF